MLPSTAPSTLTAGLATAVGSLPHRDPRSAAALVLRCLPGLPAAPQLPRRTPREGMLAQWAIGVPGIEVRPDGSLGVADGADDGPVRTSFEQGAHGGLLHFLEFAAAQRVPPRRIKVQVTGPLTLGVGFVHAGMEPRRAFALASGAARAWSRAVERLVEDLLPGAQLMLWFDEPALGQWRGGDGPVEREEATDLLSGALAAPRCVTGVHVCGATDLRLALDAGPQVLGIEVAPDLVDQAAWLARHLEGDGWIAWGAVPTDRPVGEHAAPLWRALVDLWCELTRRGCDPVRLRSQAFVTPACGLAGHGPSQAERAMRLARDLGGRVHDQAAATKLTVGA